MHFVVPTPGAASDPGGWSAIVSTVNQDVTNAGLTNHSELLFPVVAGGAYQVEVWLTLSGNNATGDITMDFQVSAGTMKGRGNCQNLTAADAIQNIIATAAGVAATTAIITGTAADLDTVIAVRVVFSFVCTNAGTFRFRFGNSAAASGRISRVWKGSVMYWKKIN